MKLGACLGKATLGALLCAGPAVACSKETPPAAEEAKAPSTPVAAAAQPPTTAAPAEPAAETVSASAPAAQPAGGQAKFAEANFELTIQPKGSYKKGQAGEAEIVLLAKEPFHVNEQYPYKFKGKEGGSLKLAAPVVGKEAVKLEKQRATMSVGFTPEASGKHMLSGQFLFSVCTDDKCLIEKRDLALELNAE